MEDPILGISTPNFEVNCPACDCTMNCEPNTVLTVKKTGNSFVICKFKCSTGCKGKNGYDLSFMMPQKKARDYSSITLQSIRNRWFSARNEWAMGEIARLAEEVRLRADLNKAYRQQELLDTNPDEIDFDELASLADKYSNSSSNNKRKRTSDSNEGETCIDEEDQ